MLLRTASDTGAVLYFVPFCDALAVFFKQDSDKNDTLMIKPPPMDPWGRESSVERAEEKHQARFA